MPNGKFLIGHLPLDICHWTFVFALPLMYLIFLKPVIILTSVSLKPFVMRTVALLLFFAAFSYAAKAQRFTLLPQVGFENSFTKIDYNNLESFKPSCGKFSPQGSLQLNYVSKQGHGFFLGAATSQPVVAVSFTDPENLVNNYTSTAGNMQLRMEGGYMFSSKAISLKCKKGSAKQSTASSSPENSSTYSKGTCQKSYSSSRCSKSNKSTAGKSKGSWMKIQPSIGMAYVPGVQSSLVSEPAGSLTNYEYRAGNWNTALLAGAGFEFGKNNARLFTVSLNYFKGLGNLDEQTITSATGTKTVTTTLESVSSGWNMRVGIPFTLGAKKNNVKPAPQVKSISTEPAKSRCGQYKTYSCGGKRVI